MTASPLVHPTVAFSMPIGAEWLCIAFVGLLIGAAILLNLRRRGLLNRDGPLAAFPVIPPPAIDGPGRFRVSGVRRDMREDAVFVCDADSAANARVKAELDGIVVTDVRRE